MDNANGRGDNQHSKDDLALPSINVAIFGKQESPNTSSISFRFISAPYNPMRCKACGMTQKECHQAWNNIHDPNDPNKFCFRGPIFTPDKNIRNIVLQYNLKHLEVPNHSSLKEDISKTSKTSLPPDLAEISTPSPRCSYTKVAIPSEKINITHDNLATSPTETSHQQDSTKSNLSKTAPQADTIESLRKYIENKETDICLGTDNADEKSGIIDDKTKGLYGQNSIQIFNKRESNH